MKSVFFTIFIMTAVLSLYSSCVNNYTKLKNKNSTISFFLPPKDSSLYIKSLTVINRIKYKEPVRDLMTAEIEIDTNNFKAVLEGIKEVIVSKKYLVNLDAQYKMFNDSIFKPFITNKSFKKTFNFNQLNDIDFSNKDNGVYLIVTIVKEYHSAPGWSGGPPVLLIHNIYDFFDIYKGLIKRRTTISRYRNANRTTWKPLTTDTRKIFDKLYLIHK